PCRSAIFAALQVCSIVNDSLDCTNRAIFTTPSLEKAVFLSNSHDSTPNSEKLGGQTSSQGMGDCDLQLKELNTTDVVGVVELSYHFRGKGPSFTHFPHLSTR
ncbi:hypothetical protein Tco_1436021, partial [Tanacetum coccineum]